MKKIVLALAVTAIAVVSQAATFKWTTSNQLLGINAAGVTDNGIYAAAGGLKGTGSYTLTLAMYDLSDNLLGVSDEITLAYSTTGGKANMKSISVDGTEVGGNTYKYIVTITGAPTALTARGVDGAYDYTAATMTATISGTVTTAASGLTTMDADLAPTTWTVSGIETSAIPEPTSGLLMLLGMAGLALRRRRA